MSLHFSGFQGPGQVMKTPVEVVGRWKDQELELQDLGVGVLKWMLQVGWQGGFQGIRE